LARGYDLDEIPRAFPLLKPYMLETFSSIVKNAIIVGLLAGFLLTGSAGLAMLGILLWGKLRRLINER